MSVSASVMWCNAMRSKQPGLISIHWVFVDNVERSEGAAGRPAAVARVRPRPAHARLHRCIRRACAAPRFRTKPHFNNNTRTTSPLTDCSPNTWRHDHDKCYRNFGASDQKTVTSGFGSPLVMLT
ncbi:hypothetical protein evm_011092 [Chilo suppressalis]|nr:hypothetical protein evm_011092 [Chilo suppressalis]